MSVRVAQQVAGSSIEGWSDLVAEVLDRLYEYSADAAPVVFAYGAADVATGFQAADQVRS